MVPTSPSGSPTAGPNSVSAGQGNYGWLFPVLSNTKRGNCVVYEAKGSERLQDVARLFSLSELRVLADNRGVVTNAEEALGGKSILLCGQFGQAAPRPVGQAAAAKAGADTAEEAGRVSRKASQTAPVTPLVSPREQEQALLELKGYLDPAGNVLKDWAPTQVAPESRVAVTSHCTWTYVACDDNNNVIRLNMVYLGLEGKLPPTSLMAKLPHLAELYLGGNQLQGTLPADWAASTKLVQLYLNDNQLTGALPPAWGNMKTLKVLSLPYNQFTGMLPTTWGKLENLEDIKLNNNKLGGAIPPTWANMDRLSTITLWNNPGLAGCLPADWAAKGTSGKGFFQSPTGVLSDDIKVATMGTAVTGFCSVNRSKAPATTVPTDSKMATNTSSPTPSAAVAKEPSAPEPKSSPAQTAGVQGSTKAPVSGTTAASSPSPVPSPAMGRTAQLSNATAAAPASAGAAGTPVGPASPPAPSASPAAAKAVSQRDTRPGRGRD